MDILGLPVTGGHKYVRLTTLLCKKKILLRTPEMRETDNLWQNCFANGDDDNTYGIAL